MSKNQRRHKGKSRRTGQRGQTLVIFALSFTVLLGLAGLAIDATRAYDLYARMQRAAEAGALAGVLYMPAYYNRIRPGDTDSAVSRASKEVVKDGFGTVLSPTASACSSTLEVSICQVTGKSDDIVVSIHETLDLVLLSGLGVQPANLTATSQAEYLPPLQIGSRLNYFGDQVECYNSLTIPNPDQTTACSPGTAGTLQSFLGTFNGPDELKENGDPYVYCEEGTSYSTTLDNTTTYTAYNGFVTNHPTTGYTAANIATHCGVPNPGVTPGNPDQQPPGFTGEATKSTAHPGAYNYYINVPQAVGNITIWVYNPSFIPSDSGGPFDHFNPGSISTGSNYFIGPNNTGIASFDGHYDAPPFYFNVNYSLYNVASFFDRTSDTLVTGITNPQVYPPYDAVSSDVSQHCGSGYQGVYNPYWDVPKPGTTPNSYYQGVVSGMGCVPLTFSPLTVYNGIVPAPCWQQWCPVFANLPSGTSYRLAIEATGLVSTTTNPDGSINYSSNLQSGYGNHSYALKVCPVSALSPISCDDGATVGNPGIQLSSWNNMDVYFSASLGNPLPNPADPSTTCVTGTPGTNYTCLDLVCIPTAYAGRSLTVQFFDPGDGGGNLFVGLAQAGVGTTNVTYPGVPAGNIISIDGDTLVHANFGTYNAFNGLWLTAAITLPSNYTGKCTPGQTQTGWWQMVYAGSNPSDVVGISFSLTGSPIHLLA